MIARRHLHLFIALLLPLMMVRGLLPAGYMPVAERGEIRMALCSDGLQSPAATDDSGDHRLPGGEGDCLFAHAAASAPLPAANGCTSIVLEDLAIRDAPAAQRTPGLLLRAQSPRGPPARS